MASSRATTSPPTKRAARARSGAHPDAEPVARLSRTQVLRHRVRVQELDRAPRADRAPDDAAILDLGVQDTGPDGALWALATRGVPVRAHEWPRALALAWTLRGAPHAYRRADLRAVEKAVRPYSEGDAARRVVNAARPLADAGIPVTEALGRVARTMRDQVTEPIVKGALSTRMTAALPGPYSRWCAPCDATHLYELTFRLAALHGGLELEPDTSPPVLRRIPRWPAAQVGDLRPSPDDGALDLVRGTLHLLGPLTEKQVATFLDAPLRDVRERWPQDAVPVEVDGAAAWCLEADLPALRSGAELSEGPSEGPSDEPSDEPVRLLGPYDLFLQGRDRDVIVPDTSRHKALWPTLGRPGAVLAGIELVGTWRPRARGDRLLLELDEWVPWDRRTREGVEREHARLAEFRGVEPA
ncbi:winged helix DNA-binding domain-containing protein [Cellulomonas sp. DKR-3]|uniref:Winged helix DNA-binding domain-containing protein n=1 Tax=Cellulomonas fulva TaxID=2835530 RepID=A0ABS5U328_9CELL|nr:crosslink repair DNA glycosylase YcaQ family protein [Cellulomonas fulva]MBT0995772.1 winged helix DNA-binding domain-containing protein [Cellulomonas fulva]